MTNTPSMTANPRITATQPGLIDRLGQKFEPRLRAIFRRLPARPSLVAGGLFILITLYLPLAVDGCGDYGGPGRALAMGKADTHWPSYLGILSHAAGRWFYVFLLAWGALAVIFALALAAKRGPSAALQKFLLVLAGTTSLLIMADICVLFLAFGPASALHIPNRVADWLGVVCLILTMLICLRCARAKSVRASIPVRLVFLIAAGAILGALGLAAYQTARGKTFENALDGPAGWVLFWTLLALYLLAPLALWYRYSLWPMADSPNLWPAVRRRLALAYVPAVAGQIWAAVVAIFEAHVWGLVVCLAGVHLVTLGYLRLARQTETAEFPAPLTVTAPGSSPGHCPAGANISL
jgi:hypothetical protein